MIIDCFLFFDELDLLEIRLNELKDVVDVFVLTESPHTFTGKIKPLYFQESRERFRSFNIVPAIYNPMTTVYRPEDYEKNQKQFNLDFAYTTLFSPGDIIIQGDCDEIPKASVIERAIKDDWKSALLVMDLYYYWLNCKRIGKKKKFKNSRMYRPEGRIEYNAKQNGKVDKIYWDGGWHFSYFGDVQEKLSSWGHAREYDRPPYNTKEHIEKCRREGLDLINHRMKFEFIDGINHLPEYVKCNIDRFKKYVWTPQ